MADQTVGALAELYLGNILYAIELAATALEGQGRTDDAAFYRGIARKLAEARGQARAARVPSGQGGARGADEPPDTVAPGGEV